MAETQVPFTIDTEKVALVVVDMQNDFVRKSAPFSCKVVTMPFPM